MNNYEDFFKGKKITMMGLGILGRGVNVARFLVERGAELTITDLKTEEHLAPSLKKLSRFKNIKYVLGKHDLADFYGKDMIIKAAGVPLDSPYIAEAIKNDIPVEMDASLFAKLSTSDVDIIGITGTRGKSTTTHLIYEILKSSGRQVHLGGNVRGLATLPLLKKIKPNDIVVMELDSWQLQGFGDARISPQIAVFTNLMNDHQNYYKNNMEKYFADKANIYRWQKEGDCLITGAKTAKLIKGKEEANGINGRLIIADSKKNPRGWETKLLGEHNRQNIALAIETVKALGIKENIIKKAVAKFKGLSGRLELIKEAKGIKFYNDTAATTPEGVLAALEALKKHKGKIILIGGGADKELEYSEYAKAVKKSVKALALFQGLASNKIIDTLGKTKFPVEVFDNMKSAMKFAVTNAKKGDIILLSPGAASFGVFCNEFDRGDKFIKEVKRLK